MHMLKRMQCIHGICVFQVQLFFVTTAYQCHRQHQRSVEVGTRCSELQIQEANVQYPSLNERTGTCRPEYYMTIHQHT